MKCQRETKIYFIIEANMMFKKSLTINCWCSQQLISAWIWFIVLNSSIVKVLVSCKSCGNEVTWLSLGQEGVLPHPGGFSLDALPSPLVHFLLADVQAAAQRLKCVPIPIRAHLEALLQDIDLCWRPFSASADRVPAFVQSRSRLESDRLGLHTLHNPRCISSV